MQLSAILFGALLLNGAEQSRTIEWNGSRLTVQAVNTALRSLVEDVAPRAGIVVTGTQHLAGVRSIDVRDASLYEGLKVLLDGVNYVIVTKGQVVHVRIHSMSGVGHSSNRGFAEQLVNALEERAQAPPRPKA